MNRKVNLVTRKAYGFRQYETIEIALFHTMGKLPEPESTHRFLSCCFYWYITLILRLYCWCQLCCSSILESKRNAGACAE